MRALPGLRLGPSTSLFDQPAAGCEQRSKREAAVEAEGMGGTL
jgi:hypothetical protein